ncbi:MAG: hypothetical protein K0R38_3894 [Polyangiaceae bacterium]|jgi:uncharacterized metal-binding protein YceD (DUF177 family)|nr:hypothetical protein [Polyangiaceae bacterium]
MSPELVIPVADLEQGPKHAVFALSEAWLRRALQDTDATVSAPGKLDVTVSKNGTSVLVRGHLEADLTLPCVVTLDPVPVPVRTEVVLMLSPKSGATTAHESHVARRRARPEPKPGLSAEKSGPEKPTRARNSGKSEGKWDETPTLTEEIAGQDTYDGHEIALDDFVREFIILELPMFPRRSDLPTEQTAANPPLPADSQPGGEKPLDPRLSPLAELKSRLEQKIKKE